MQIICNNCGNDLTFPNQQEQVTCPHCYTHLQLEEINNTITATVVENFDFNHSAFLSLNQLATIQSFTPLYNLLDLELEYNEAMEKYFFRSVLVGKQFRPVMTRGVFRLFVGFFIIFFFVTPIVFNFISIIFIIYGGFLIFVGIIECIKSWRFRQFEKDFFEEQIRLNEEIQTINLPEHLNNWYFSYSQNSQKHLKVREDYLYQKLFNKITIKTPTPYLSQAFRVLIITGILISFLVAYEEMNLPILTGITILAILISVILFFIILRKGNNYTSKYLTILNRRSEIIKELDKYLSQ